LAETQQTQAQQLPAHSDLPEGDWKKALQTASAVPRKMAAMQRKRERLRTRKKNV
jgi:hypothetical protein